MGEGKIALRVVFEAESGRGGTLIRIFHWEARFGEFERLGTFRLKAELGAAVVGVEQKVDAGLGELA